MKLTISKMNFLLKTSKEASFRYTVLPKLSNIYFSIVEAYANGKEDRDVLSFATSRLENYELQVPALKNGIPDTLRLASVEPYKPENYF